MFRYYEEHISFSILGKKNDMKCWCLCWSHKRLLVTLHIFCPDHYVRESYTPCNKYSESKKNLTNFLHSANN